MILTFLRTPISLFCYKRNGDNAGPPKASDIVKTLNSIQSEFPNAVVTIDTFESFTDTLMAEPDIVASLPVYTQEMGDTWYVIFNIYVRTFYSFWFFLCLLVCFLF